MKLLKIIISGGILLSLVTLFVINLYSMEYKFIQNEKDRNEITKMLKELKNNVTLFVFTKQKDCQYCDLALQISKEISSLSKKIKYKRYDIDKSKSIANRYNIKDAPSIAVVGKKDYGIRFLGIPVGYEFYSLIESIKLASNNETFIKGENKEKIKKINSKIDIDVFITPKCPYCPRAVVTSFNIAFLNDNITARMIEAYEFPELTQTNNVSSVPKIIIKKGDKKVEFVGALPEKQFIQKVLSILSQ